MQLFSNTYFKDNYIHLKDAFEATALSEPASAASNVDWHQARKAFAIIAQELFEWTGYH